MPSTVSQLFSSASIRNSGCVPWGTPVPCKHGGVYLVSISESVFHKADPVSRAPICEKRVKEWISLVPKMRVDGDRPSVAKLVKVLSAFWIPDESVIYIGKTSQSLRDRINSFYRTKIGCARPHRGGYWVKMLDDCQRLWIHFSECDEPFRVEQKMLGFFVCGVSENSRRAIREPEHAFPFANMEYPPGSRKHHGISRATRD